VPDDFRIRPLHRQRGGRRKAVRVLDQAELADLLGVAPADLAQRLNELGWHYHRDSAGRIWATEQTRPPAGV
jgi:DNA-binding transcriptional regulator YdaS (Cro superfamily)